MSLDYAVERRGASRTTGASDTTLRKSGRKDARSAGWAHLWRCAAASRYGEAKLRLASFQDLLTEANKMLSMRDSAAAESGVPGVTPFAGDLTAVDELRLDLSGTKPRWLFPAPWQRSGLIP